MAGERLQDRLGRVSQVQVTLVAHDIHDTGGMERAFGELIRALHGDFDLTVVSSTLAEDLRTLVRWRRVRVPRRPFPVKFVVFFARAGLVVAQERGGIVHTLGAIVPGRADVASLHFCHAGFRAATGALTPAGAPVWRRINSGVGRLVALRAERWCYRPSRLRALAAVSLGVQREAEEHYSGVPVTLTPNGVDIERFRPDPERRSVIRSAAGVRDGICVALFVGGDWDRKGLALAVEGVAKACLAGADIVLWVVGAGNSARFEALAQRLGVEERVTFFGSRADTESFYRGADLFVLPSSYETFGIVCFEAAACGLPLVIPRISGAGELVEDNGAGLLIERTAESVASALQSLAADPLMRTSLGLEARRRASEFTWGASTAAVSSLYRSLLSTGLSDEVERATG